MTASSPKGPTWCAWRRSPHQLFLPQDFALPRRGLVQNIVAFNVGVEIGQLLALSAILIVMAYWRRTAAFQRQAFATNVLIIR